MNIFDNWDETKAALQEGLSPDRMRAMDTILNNQRTMIINSQPHRRSVWKRTKMRVHFWLFKLKIAKTNPYATAFTSLMPSIRNIIP